MVSLDGNGDVVYDPTVSATLQALGDGLAVTDAVGHTVAGAGMWPINVVPGTGGDTVLDYTDGVDRIDVSGFPALNQIGADVVIDLDGGDQAALLGVDLADLDNSHFLLCRPTRMAGLVLARAKRLVDTAANAPINSAASNPA